MGCYCILYKIVVYIYISLFSYFVFYVVDVCMGSGDKDSSIRTGILVSRNDNGGVNACICQQRSSSLVAELRELSRSMPDQPRPFAATMQESPNSTPYNKAPQYQIPNTFNHNSPPPSITFPYPLRPTKTPDNASTTQMSTITAHTSTRTAQSAAPKTGLLPLENVESTNSNGNFAPKCSTATLTPLLNPSSWNPYFVQAPT